MLTAAVRDARLNPCQLSSRPLSSTLSRLVCPKVALDFAALGPAMMFTGAMPESCFTLIFILACPEKGRVLNLAIEHVDGYIGFFPPGCLLDAVTPAGYSNASLTVPIAEFHAAIASQFPEVPENVLTHGAGLRVGPVEQVRLRTLLAALKDVVGNRAESLASTVVRQNIERDLLEAFLAALRSGCESVFPPSRTRSGGRLKRIGQARDFIAAHLQTPIYLKDLGTALQVTPRGLEILFQDLLGVSPITYLRHQRLHGVRRGLQDADPAPGVVKEVALNWGFWHLGNFAHDYRQLFGESPSATLASSAHGSYQEMGGLPGPASFGMSRVV